MTDDEFEVWVDRHQTLFPKLREWLGEQPDPAVILTAWSNALRTCEANHAGEATDRLLRGVDPVVKFNDWSELPAVMIQHCRAMGSGTAGRTGDGNFVSGAALKALKSVLREEAKDDDAGAIRELRQLVEGMEPGELKQTKALILGAMDARISAGTAYELLNLADAKHATFPPGNLGESLTG